MIPRRNRLDLNKPVELKILSLLKEIERLGCHALITEAISLIEQAKEKVSDFIDEESSKSLSQIAHAAILHEEDRKAFAEIDRLSFELTKENESLMQWGYEEYLYQLPLCMCGGKPIYSSVDFFIRSQKPHILECDKCHKIVGNQSSIRCMEIWLSGSVNPSFKIQTYGTAIDS